MVADELDADWTLVRVEVRAGRRKLYNNLTFGQMQGTGGSTAIANSWEQMRKAGATARAMLVAAAAQPGRCRPPRSRSQGRGLARRSKRARDVRRARQAAASRYRRRRTSTLKDPSKFTLIGTHRCTRVDSPRSSTDRAVYTIDVEAARHADRGDRASASFGATVGSFDAAAAKA